MVLELTEEQRDVLTHVIETELARLPIEIHRTEAREFRKALEAREECLRSVQQSLQTHAGVLTPR